MSNEPPQEAGPILGRVNILNQIEVCTTAIARMERDNYSLSSKSPVSINELKALRAVLYELIVIKGGVA